VAAFVDSLLEATRAEADRWDSLEEVMAEARWSTQFAREQTCGEVRRAADPAPAPTET